MSRRSEAIRLKVMPGGRIRAFDAVKHQGVSEWYIDNPRGLLVPSQHVAMRERCT